MNTEVYIAIVTFSRQFLRFLEDIVKTVSAHTVKCIPGLFLFSCKKRGKKSLDYIDFKCIKCCVSMLISLFV